VGARGRPAHLLFFTNRLLTHWFLDFLRDGNFPAQAGNQFVDTLLKSAIPEQTRFVNPDRKQAMVRIQGKVQFQRLPVDSTLGTLQIHGKMLSLRSHILGNVPTHRDCRTGRTFIILGRVIHTYFGKVECHVFC
jgi:hypothetical protein